MSGVGNYGSGGDGGGTGDSPSSLKATLEERGARYGEFADNAAIAQRLKTVIVQSEGSIRLTNTQREALDQIASKISRILTGDPNYKDNWHDIAGYAKLAEDRCGVRPVLPMSFNAMTGKNAG